MKSQKDSFRLAGIAAVSVFLVAPAAVQMPIARVCAVLALAQILFGFILDFTFQPDETNK